MKILCTENQCQIFEAIEGYKPVKGQNVDSRNKTNNEKYYKDTEKKAKDYDGGLKDNNSIEVEKTESSKAANVNSLGMERLSYSSEPSDKFKARAEAQMLGKNSDIQEDIDDKESGVDTKGNEKRLETAVEMSKFDNDHRGIGDKNAALVQFGDDIEIVPGVKAGQKRMAYESNNKMKRLNFEKQTFLNEEHMFSLIPEEYRVDESKFYMRDNQNNQYLVEWKNGKPSVYDPKKEALNEEINKLKHLWSYNSRSYFNAKSNRGEIK